jgi:hypothetical protein
MERLCAIVLALAGTAYRVALTLGDAPPANSDEGTAGLAALHISEGRHMPIFFYGQEYMGTLHSFLAAPLVQLFGTHWWTIRIPSIGMYVAFLALMYWLTRRLYTPWFAVFAVGVLALGSDRVVKDQVIGVGGYSEVSVATVASMLIAVSLVLSKAPARPVAYATWGLVAGFVTWTHWLGLPFIAISATLLVALRRPDFRGRTVCLTVAGFLVGSAPLIWHNLFSGETNSLSVLLNISGAAQSASWLDRLYGSIVIGLPLSSGLCAPSNCYSWQLWWGPVYVVLMVAALVMAFRSVRHDTGVARSRAAGRFALAAGGALTLLAYVASASAANTPIESARYLHYGLVSLPAVMWPLWAMAKSTVGAASDRIAGWPTSPRRALGLGSAVVLVGFCGNALVATGQLVRHQPQYETRATDERVLVQHLLGHQLNHLYSEYWTCNRLAYVTSEQIRCAVLDDDLSPGLDRYAFYRNDVQQADRVAYVFPLDTAADNRLASFATSIGETVEVEQIAGYNVYTFADHRPT